VQAGWAHYHSRRHETIPQQTVNFEPQKFFIDIIEFFSILLPGALLTYLLMQPVGSWLLGPRLDGLHGSTGWLAFAFASYLLGHVIFLYGSFLDRLYDRLRRGSYTGQVRELARGRKLSSRIVRWLAKLMVSPNSDEAVRQAELAMRRSLEPIAAANAINAFQWAKARLALTQPHALATVHRFEADSKFFRNFVVLSCVLIPAGALLSWPALVVTFGALLPAAFVRYFDQRLKGVNHAYWYVLTLGAGAAGEMVARSTAHASHAGGVVYEQTKQGLRFLLITAHDQMCDDDAVQWLLPKGHIRSGETMREAAVREVREETGCWARVVATLEIIEYAHAHETVRVQFYLMERVRRERAREQRCTRWFTLPDVERLPEAQLPAEVRTTLTEAAAYCAHAQMRAEHRRARHELRCGGGGSTTDAPFQTHGTQTTPAGGRSSWLHCPT
jgi:8-oxo-dGTP pyrophosphatase MutT (NUDIX family)/uncharacterized membrane protein